MISSIRIPFLDLHAQYETIKDELWAAMRSVVESNAFILGPAVETFERDFAGYCGAAHCVAAGSGTAALHLALLAHGIGPGDEVIVQANTFVATVEAMLYVGATPVLVDVRPPTYAVDPAAIEAAVTPRTKAIVPVHLFGQPCDMDAVEAVAERHGLLIVEDASQAHGATYRGRVIGSRHTACFSFYPGKNLGAYGEGGCVVTNDPAIAARMRRLRNHGSDERYVHAELGYNYRLDGIQGAVLGVKLRHLPQWNRGRRAVAAAYDARLPERVLRPSVPSDVEHVYHIYPIFVDNRDEMRRRLAEGGIETNVHYPVPVHLQPGYQSLGYRRGQFPHAEYVASHELSLPIFPEMTTAMVDEVVSAITGLL